MWRKAALSTGRAPVGEDVLHREPQAVAGVGDVVHDQDPFPFYRPR